MKRLDRSTLGSLPAAVRRPGYDRTRLAVGMAHLGVGAFHRCHQAEYTDDMLEAEFGPWGVVGINLRPPRLSPTLGVQDGLYTRRLEADDRPPDLRVIGSILAVIDAEADLTAALATVADPAVQVMTLTVTEKGYCHVPSTGTIDTDHPDIVHDLASPETPRSVPGVLVAALERRRARDPSARLTLISCDNIPSNGAILERVVRMVARERSPDLDTWVGDHVAFPSTMVDRIVPAVASTEAQRIAAAIGLEDRAGVVGEPFRQWVIEDRFAGARPPWDRAGAEFVNDVGAHELIKMRVLNGAQTTFATLGATLGLETTFEDARHAVLGPLVRAMLERETAATLPVVPGMEAHAYIDTSLSRLRNTAIRHTNHQIATDSSQKIVQRLLNPIRELLTRNRPVDLLACATAGVVVYLARGSLALGATWQPNDPFADTIGRLADEVGPSPEALVRRVLGISNVFGTDLIQHQGFVETLTRHVAGLLGAAPDAYLAGVLAQQG